MLLLVEIGLVLEEGCSKTYMIGTLETSHDNMDIIHVREPGFIKLFFYEFSSNTIGDTKVLSSKTVLKMY